MRTLLLITYLLFQQGVGFQGVSRVGDGVDSRSLIFDETGDYIAITDHADITIPANTDFTSMVWVKPTDIATGGDFKYFFSTGNFDADDSINMYIDEDIDLDFKTTSQDGGGVNGGPVGGSNLSEDEWLLLAAVYDEGTTDYRVVECDRGGSCRTTGNETVNFNSVFDSSVWEFGRRADNDPNRYFKGSLAYGAVCNQGFTNAELSLLALGTRANFEAEVSNCSFFLNDIMDDDLGTNCGGSGCTVTQNGGPPIDEDGPFDITDSQFLIFDEIDDYVAITDHADMTIAANSDFSVMAWVYQSTQPDGGDLKYVFSTGALTDTDMIQVFLREDTPFDSTAIVDIDDTEVSAASGSQFPIREWTLLTLVYDEAATTQRIVECNRAGTCATTISETIDWSAELNASTWNCGRRGDGDANRYYGGRMAYCALCETKYSNAELSSLASGTQANFEAEASNCTFFLNDILDDDLTTNCGGSGCTVIQNGSPVIGNGGPFD